MTMIFSTRVNGIPCKCQVLDYSPGYPMVITGSGFGDAIPPDPAEFHFVLLDRKGYVASWLDKYVDSEVTYRLMREYENLVCDPTEYSDYELEPLGDF